jgi:heat-inducible transcriptional repressor
MNVDLTPRQAKILASIVKEYCETNEPVASKELVEKYDFAISGATVRNEMQALEKMGYIMHPHTSAGRIPTDAGFRYFVNQLMERVKLSAKEQERLRVEVVKLQTINLEISKRLTKLMTEVSGNTSFALFPEEAASSGFSKLLESPQFTKADAKAVAEFLDNLDERAPELLEEFGEEAPKAVFGGEAKEIALSESSDYSLVLSGLKLPTGKHGVIGLIGPKSMKYEKNLSLMDYISKLLAGKKD